MNGLVVVIIRKASLLMPISHFISEKHIFFISDVNTHNLWLELLMVSRGQGSRRLTLMFSHLPNLTPGMRIPPMPFMRGFECHAELIFPYGRTLCNLEAEELLNAA